MPRYEARLHLSFYTHDQESADQSACDLESAINSNLEHDVGRWPSATNPYVSLDESGPELVDPDD